MFVLIVVGFVLLLLFLVMKVCMYVFLVLMVVFMGVGFFFGMLFDKIVVMMEKGMGGIFGFLVVVVVLGVMFGKILYEIGVVD